MAVRAAFWLFAALMVWAPFPLGSNRPWAWMILEVGIFATAALWTVGWMRGQAGSLELLKSARPALALFATWVVFVALQWIPLPADWVRALSPEAAAMHGLAAAYGAGGRMTLSVDPNATYVNWLLSCAWFTAFFLVLALANTRSNARYLALAFVTAGIVQATYAGLMHLTGTNLEIFGAKIPHAGQASGGYVNRNNLAGLLEMALPLGIGLMMSALQETGRRTWRQFARDTAQLLLSPKAPLRIFLIVMVIALVMTRSRMGNTAFFSSLLIAGGVALLLSRHATRSTVVLIASLIVIDIFVVGAWFGVEKTLDRIQQTTRQDVEERVEPTGYALEMAKDYPLFGAGSGTFYTAFTRYRGSDLKPFYHHAHNDYVQFLVEYGAVGVALVAGLPLWALVLAVLALSRRRDPLARGFAFAVIMGVSALAIHSTVEFNLQIPANAFLFTVLIAYAWVAFYLERHATGHDPRQDARS
jgi:O-antigen ligase